MAIRSLQPVKHLMSSPCSLKCQTLNTNFRPLWAHVCGKVPTCNHHRLNLNKNHKLKQGLFTPAGPQVRTSAPKFSLMMHLSERLIAPGHPPCGSCYIPICRLNLAYNSLWTIPYGLSPFFYCCLDDHSKKGEALGSSDERAPP